jgi:hypothetical protein
MMDIYQTPHNKKETDSLESQFADSVRRINDLERAKSQEVVKANNLAPSGNLPLITEESHKHEESLMISV